MESLTQERRNKTKNEISQDRSFTVGKKSSQTISRPRSTNSRIRSISVENKAGSFIFVHYFLEEVEKNISFPKPTYYTSSNTKKPSRRLPFVAFYVIKIGLLIEYQRGEKSNTTSD